MAPMILTAESELRNAPHTLKATDSFTAEPEAEQAMTVQPQCQICFDTIEQTHEEEKENATAITAFCGSACPAILCRACTAEHVRVSVAAAFPGVLPKVRCPICLVQVNKATWSHVVSQDVLKTYVQACRTACSFQSPCCHDTGYTHLPREIGATDLPSKYIKPAALTLDAELTTKLELLHDQTRRFCAFEISSKDLIIFIEDTFGRHVNEETQLLILEHELPTILDDERRATLLLSYHAKYKVVTTRCCGYKACFNCKRNMSSHPNGDTTSCDQEALDASCIVECRSCHVTMVKVEGCSSVRCWCGFAMDWPREVRLRDRYKKGLIPVDIYDIKTHKAWETWQQTLINFVTNELLPLRLAMRLSRIDQQLLLIKGLRSTLRKLLHRQYIWRGRFKRALPKMQQEIVKVRMLILAKRLKKHNGFAVAVGRAKWRRRFARVLPQLEKELAERRMARCVAKLSKLTSFVEAVRKAKCRACWTRVVKSIHAKRFWINYAREHPEEQRALREEEMAMLLPGL